MSSGDLIPKSGLCCAVASCKQHSGNAIEEGYNISFHKFPKDLQLQKIWAQKCKIVGTWNPQSYVCSMHFSPDGFVQDLKAELCGYLPSYRHLRQDVIPTLNLQIDSEKTSTKCSSSIDPKTAQHVRDILTKAFPSRFSSNELFKKKEKKKKQKYWSREEIASAFTLIYHSKKAYAYLKNELHYSLPGIAYIQRWAKSINMKKGLNEDILKIMKLNSDNIEDDEKLTVLMFGEIKVCSKVEYDVLNDEIVGPHNQMQIVMAQGISSKWKQPIFVDFDVNMTKTILYNIIDKLDNIGYKVICCVTNCSSKNVELWNQLGVTFENPTFFIPNGRKIVFIPDSSHLLMLLRNCFLDTGFTLNGADINKKPIKALIAKSSSEIGVYSKLRKEHISCKGPQRENFKLAKELLSHSTALALQHYRPTADYQVLDDTAEFIKLISNFFKFTNVSELKDNGMFKSPFGMYLYEQNKILNETYSVIKLMKCKGNNNSNLLMFQKCIMMYINSVKILYLIIKENYGIDNLLTTKINNNALDYLFHQLCFTEDCPSALNAVDRLRMIILGIYPSNKTNIKDYNQDEFIVAQVFKLTEINLNDEHNDREDSEESDTDTIDENKFIVTHKDENKKEMELNAIEYLAGWVALKYKSKIPEIGYTVACNESNNSSGQDIMMPSWMNHLSYDRLIIPSNDFKKMILRVEWLFNKFTKKRKNPEGSDVVAKLTNKMFSRMPVEKKI